MRIKNVFLVLAPSIVYGLIYELWNSIFIKSVACLLTVFPYAVKKSNLIFHILLYLFPIIYWVLNQPFYLYHLRALFFISGINVLMFMIQSWGQNERLHYEPIDQKKVISVTLSVLAMGNVAFLLTGDAIFANNFVAEEADRYRGVFPEVLALALVLSIKNKFIASLFVPLITMGLYLITGTRGSSVFFAISALVAIFWSARIFFSYLVFQALILYPLILFIIMIFIEPTGSFLIKNQGLITLINDFNPFGSGIQAPINEIYGERISASGFHFSAADYGLFGLSYELGLFAAALRLYVIFLIFSRLRNMPNTSAVKLLLFAVTPLATGYGIGFDLFYGISSIMLFYAVSTQGLGFRGLAHGMNIK
jgi:hypothetical protein